LGSQIHSHIGIGGIPHVILRPGKTAEQQENQSQKKRPNDCPHFLSFLNYWWKTGLPNLHLPLQGPAVFSHASHLDKAIIRYRGLKENRGIPEFELLNG
jgi:hypothetical protein